MTREGARPLEANWWQPIPRLHASLGSQSPVKPFAKERLGNGSDALSAPARPADRGPRTPATSLRCAGPQPARRARSRSRKAWTASGWANCNSYRAVAISRLTLFDFGPDGALRGRRRSFTTGPVLAERRGCAAASVATLQSPAGGCRREHSDGLKSTGGPNPEEGRPYLAARTLTASPWVTQTSPLRWSAAAQTGAGPTGIDSTSQVGVAVDDFYRAVEEGRDIDIPVAHVEGDPERAAANERPARRAPPVRASMALTVAPPKLAT